MYHQDLIVPKIQLHLLEPQNVVGHLQIYNQKVSLIFLWLNFQQHQHAHIHCSIFFQDNLLRIYLLIQILEPLKQLGKLYFQKQLILYVVVVFLAHRLWLYVILDQLQISCLQKSFYNFNLNSFFH